MPKTTITNDNQNIPYEQEEKRGRRTGGILFPRTSLKKALEVAKAIWRDNAGDPYDPILLATKSLNWSPRSSGFEILLASSERYGLTVGNSRAKAIQLTQLGSAVVSPTDESQIGANLGRALLTPKIFEQVYNKYERKNIPREEIVKNTLIKEFNVPKSDVDICYEMIMQNIKDYDLIVKSGENQILYLDNLGKAISTEQIEEESQTSEVVAEPSEQLEGQRQLTQLSVTPRVFISHSKNMKILNQIKQMLEFGKFEYEVAVERETTAIPIPEKIFGLMRKCNCAVINVSADEQEKREDSTYGINQNVLIEIGAAFLQYNKRVILLVDKRVKLPSNLQGLYASYYEGDELSWETGMKVQQALTEFRNAI